MAPQDSDAKLEALLARIGARDRTAFGEFYALTSAKLFALALRILRDRGAAEEALQETFIEVWDRATSFDPARGSVRAWLAVIARSRSIDHLRRSGPVAQRETAASEDAIGTVADERALADGGVELLALLTCLGRLDPEDRDLVLRAYYEGLSMQELATRSGKPVNSVKSRLRRSLARLRSCLGDE
ncbi:MAG: sigma-70 family RNA polymerase sigma factor [Paracoccaceae bacterium]